MFYPFFGSRFVCGVLKINRNVFVITVYSKRHFIVSNCWCNAITFRRNFYTCRCVAKGFHNPKSKSWAPRFESYPQINSGLLSINAKPQVIEFFAAHPERWNINGATKMNAILSRYSEIVNSQQPSGDKNQEIHNPANAQLKTLY